MSCRAQIAAFVLGILYTLLLVPLVKRLAVACRALDKPNARKVHKDLGGIKIVTQKAQGAAR